MALINCPECGKEVSDKAYACPVCGFPIREHLSMEKAQKEEAIRVENEERIKQEQASFLAQKKAEYNSALQYELCGKSLVFSRNERICALLGAAFYIQSMELHQKFLDYSLDAEWGNLLLSYDNFDSLWDDCLFELITRPFFSLSINALDKIITDREDLKTKIADRLLSIDSVEVQDSLENVWISACDHYYEVMNDEERKCQETLSWEAEPIIDSVFSSSFPGLVRASISATAVNSMYKAILTPFDLLNKKIAKDEYANIKAISLLKFSTSMMGELNHWVEIYSDTYKKVIIEELVAADELFETYSFPKDGFNSLEHINDYIGDDLSSISQKEKLIEVLEKDPGNAYIYANALMYIPFTEKELDELLKFMVDFMVVSSTANALEAEKKNETLELVEWLDGNKTSKDLAAFISTCPRYRKGEGTLFNEIEDKDIYFKDKTEYKEQVDAFLNMNLCNIKKFKGALNGLKELECPLSDEWKKKLGDTIKCGEAILFEISNNHFIEDIESSLCFLYKTDEPEDSNHYDQNIYPFTVGEILDNREEKFKKFKRNGLKFHEYEIPLVKIGNEILITSRAINYWNYRKGSLDWPMDIYTHRFSISDISDIIVNERSVQFTYLQDSRECVFEHRFYNAMIAITFCDFAKKLRDYIKSEQFQSIIKERGSQTGDSKRMNTSLLARLKLRIMFREAYYVRQKCFPKLWGENYKAYEDEYIPMSVRDRIKRDREYVIYVNKKRDDTKGATAFFMITDQTLTIDNDVFLLDSIRTISTFETKVDDWNMEGIPGYSKYLVVIEFEDGDDKRIILSGDIDSNEPFLNLQVLDCVIRKLRAPLWNLAYHDYYLKGFCTNCGGRYVNFSRLKNVCVVCKNTNPSQLFFLCGDPLQYAALIDERLEVVLDNKNDDVNPRDCIDEAERKDISDELDSKDSGMEFNGDMSLPKKTVTREVFCQKCGKRIEVVSKFCKYCGQPNVLYDE